MDINVNRYLKLSIPDRQKQVRRLLEDTLVGLTIFSLEPNAAATEFNARLGRPLKEKVTAQDVNESIQLLCREINSLISEVNEARDCREVPDPLSPKERLDLELCAKHHGERSDS